MGYIVPQLKALLDWLYLRDLYHVLLQLWEPNLSAYMFSRVAICFIFLKLLFIGKRYDIYKGVLLNNQPVTPSFEIYSYNMNEQE